MFEFLAEDEMLKEVQEIQHYFLEMSVNMKKYLKAAYMLGLRLDSPQAGLNIQEMFQHHSGITPELMQECIALHRKYEYRDGIDEELVKHNPAELSLMTLSSYGSTEPLLAIAENLRHALWLEREQLRSLHFKSISRGVLINLHRVLSHLAPLSNIHIDNNFLKYSDCVFCDNEDNRAGAEGNRIISVADMPMPICSECEYISEGLHIDPIWRKVATLYYSYSIELEEGYEALLDSQRSSESTR